MNLKPVDYWADGVRLTGFLADGSQGRPAPGIIVAHESPGLTEQIKGRAAALAEHGYVALALDLFGAHDLTLEEARRHSGLVVNTPGLMYTRTNAALDALAAQPHVDAARLAGVGYCLGGAAVIELARHGAPLKCVVGFHPGLKRPAGSPDGVSVSAKLLMLIGDLDPVVPPEDRVAFAQSMTAAGAEWELHVFGGVGHSFTNPAIDSFRLPGFGYNARADRRSWRMALDFLGEHLGHP